MPKYEVQLSRWVSAQQCATVIVEADNAEDAGERAWDLEPNWTVTKLYDSDQREVEVEEIPA